MTATLAQRQASREALRAAFRAARKVRIGDTLYIGNGPETEAAIKKGLARGETVEENGVKQWVSLNVIHDHTKEGSAAYIWQGDKVKHEKVLCTKDKDGKLTMKTIGYCFREWNV